MNPLDPIYMLEPFSVPVTAPVPVPVPVQYESPADVAAVAADRRQALSAHHAIAVMAGWPMRYGDIAAPAAAAVVNQVVGVHVVDGQYEGDLVAKVE